MRYLLTILIALFLPVCALAQQLNPGGGSGIGNSINNISVNGIINVMAQPFGARCDGTTDDTGAFMRAYNFANPSHGILIPPGVTCAVTQLDWSGANQLKVYGPGATVRFTGAGLDGGLACSETNNGSGKTTGGLW